MRNKRIQNPYQDVKKQSLSNVVVMQNVFSQFILPYKKKKNYLIFNFQITGFLTLIQNNTSNVYTLTRQSVLITIIYVMIWLKLQHDVPDMLVLKKLFTILPFR